MSRFVVFGARGMLGRALVDVLSRRGEPHVGVDLPEIDIADPASVVRLIADESPEVLLNAAAWTDVDGAESDPEGAARANVDGPRVLAEAAAKTGALLVHMSTDYVFGVAGGEPFPDDFVLTILRAAREGRELRVVDDQRGSPTYAPDLARAILDLVGSGATGTFHAANSGAATWHDLAAETVKLAGIDVPVARATTADFPRPAPRPEYSVLSTAKLEAALGRPMRPWREALADCVARLAKEDE